MKHETKIDGTTVIVTFSGEIDLEHSPKAREVLLDGLDKGRSMIVDMSGVNVIDSSGVASLLEAFQLARNKGMDFYIAAITDPVFRVFKLARLETVFDIVDSVADGMDKV
ncbi:MAG TPA: anti-sigma factor antagonist [Rhodospirillales bacterium]|nr:anti-sigma factor antagonist [Rhodospirillales bacterium]